jgi:hypothetical protein
MADTFYILAEEPSTGVYGRETLCKFGSTDGPVSKRRSDHVRMLNQEEGIHAQLEIYFVATGAIAGKEKHVKNRTKGEGFAMPFKTRTEWRVCYPPKLAKVSMEVAKEGAGSFAMQYIRESRHRGSSGPGELLLSTYLPKTVYDRLHRRSKDTGRSLGELTTEALGRYLDE